MTEVILPGGIPFIQNSSNGVTTDTLLLAASLHIPPGSLVFDLGCGSGGAMIVSSILNPGCIWIGVDHQMDLLSSVEVSRSLQSSIPDMASVCCDVSNISSLFSEGIARAVIINPPFRKDGTGRLSFNRAREKSRAGTDLLLYQFIRGASHLLEDGGLMIMINRPERLTDVLLGCSSMNLNPAEIQPVGIQGQPAEHILLHCRKNGSSALIMLPQVQSEEIIRRITARG